MDEKLQNEIAKAKKLLTENGYTIIRLSKAMIEASELCEARQENGEEDMECLGCECSVCIMQL